MKRIDSYFQCCIKDGSWPAVYVIQLMFANHSAQAEQAPELLYPKIMVLNVQAKGANLWPGSVKCKEAERK